MARKPPPSNVENRLRAFIDRVENLEEQIALLKEDVKEVYSEAKSSGFDPKVMRAIVSDRKKDPDKLAEFEVLREIYRAALGMLGGTPLGDAARRRFLQDRPSAAQETAQDEAGGQEALPEDGEAAPAAPSADSIAAARAEGGEAAKAGRRVLDNPYAAGDARRAAWDEGWCASSASDGMDIPSAWRRNKPSKPTDQQQSNAGSQPQGAEGSGEGGQA